MSEGRFSSVDISNLHNGLVVTHQLALNYGEAKTQYMLAWDHHAIYGQAQARALCNLGNLSQVILHRMTGLLITTQKF